MRAWPVWPSAWAAVCILGIAILNPDPATAQTLCIGKESVLLRAGPSWRQDPVGSLPAGACGVQVVGKCVSGWCEVALGSRRGWVDSKLVNVQEGTPPAARERAPKRQAAPPPPPPREIEPQPRSRAAAPSAKQDGHCVMGVRPGDTLRIRTGPSAENREVGGIPPNACGVTVGSPCRGSWCPVSYRGIRGWSNASYLRPPWLR